MKAVGVNVAAVNAAGAQIGGSMLGVMNAVVVVAGAWGY